MRHMCLPHYIGNLYACKQKHCCNIFGYNNATQDAYFSLVSLTPRLLVVARIDGRVELLRALLARLQDLTAFFSPTATFVCDEFTQRFPIRPASSRLSEDAAMNVVGLGIKETLYLLVSKLQFVVSCTFDVDHNLFWSFALDFTLWCDYSRTACAVSLTFACQCLRDASSRRERILSFFAVRQVLLRTERDYLLREIRLHVRL